MKYAFVNPNWSFTGSTYFGCRDPHYPLELMFSIQKVEAAGHKALLVDAQIDDLPMEEVRRRETEFVPDFLVIPTAPSYLFWRCPPPELRVPMEYFRALDTGGTKVCIGPHSSATPVAVLRKTGADIAIKGEAEQAVVELAAKPWEQIDGVCYRRKDGTLHISPALSAVDMRTLGALDFSNYNVEAHAHRHHVFWGSGRGAELEFARGCPWNCYFCNKQLFRNKFRERPVEALIAEIDSLIARGVDYVYFIDEIFGVGKNVRTLLEAISQRNISIGFQTRIDLWDEESLDLLGRARCISMECGIESITEEGREELNKNCRMTTERITELLIYAKEKAGIAWVQANLILTDKDDKNEIHRWQQKLKEHGVWVSEPVPMFPFPGSPLYTQTFGAAPDDEAWERAHSHYMSLFSEGDWSDIQEQRPRPIAELESAEESAAR
jgi:B12-binding domain/radical SAM domain protein of rhizo-twelve system